VGKTAGHSGQQKNMKNILPAALFLMMVASCKKSSEVTENLYTVNVTAAVTQEIVSTPSGTFKYWKSIATVDKMVYDTSFVIVQWDAYSAPGAYESTMRDTVTFLPYQTGTISHRSRTVYMNPWFAQDVKVSDAWDKHGKHHFKW
jgi:hypothetical protein